MINPTKKLSPQQNHKKKILLVYEHYPPKVGGGELMFSTLAEGLAKRGHECHVVTCRLANTPKEEEMNGVQIHRVGIPHSADRYWFTFLALPKVMRLLKDADIMQTTQFNAAFPSWFASKLLRKKSVITIHEVWGGLWSNMPGANRVFAHQHRLMERTMLGLPFDKYVCVSRSTRNSLRLIGIPDGKISVVYNGIDEELFDPDKADRMRVRKQLKLQDKFVLLFYGRPGVSKGLEYLVEAIPLIRERVSEAHFMFILAKRPENGYEETVRAVKKLNLNGQLTLQDPVAREDLPDYIAAADCVLVPSLSEGFGFTAAEACALDRPVVASDVASLPEVVSGKYVLVEPRSPEAIAEAVERVYKGDVEQSPKKRFGWDECVDRYVQIYEELLA